MAIIGAGLEDQSYSSDESYNHIFLDTDESLARGLYFQRGKAIRGPEFLDPFHQALINVGGTQYAFPWSTLDDFPQSRLSHLRFCTTIKEMAQFCDDYDSMHHEFFFDRDPLSFRTIFNHLAKGKLLLLQDVCNVALHTELLYWGIDVEKLAPCCHHSVMSSVEEVEQHQRKEEEWCERRRALRANAAQGNLFHMLGEAVENPHSGCLGKVFAILSVIMVVITVVSLCISTMPDHDVDEDTTKLEFARGPLNIIDVAAILPYYVSLFLELRDESMEDFVAGAGKSTLDKLGLILRVLRALRILYVMRLARHSLGLQTLGLTIQRSFKDFGLLLLYVCFAVTLFSPLVHLSESELAPNAAKSPPLSFSSIPASYWWSIISVTTVGYGDMVPHSIPGQLVALIVIIAGILLLSFPSTSIFHTFSRAYSELKEEHNRLWKEERGAELATEAEESTKERDSWPENWSEPEFLPGLDDPYYLFIDDIKVLAKSTSCQPLIAPVTC